MFVGISLMIGCVCGYLGLKCSVFVVNSVVGCDSFLLCWVLGLFVSFSAFVLVCCVVACAGGGFS